MNSFWEYSGPLSLPLPAPPAVERYRDKDGILWCWTEESQETEIERYVEVVW